MFKSSSWCLGFSRALCLSNIKRCFIAVFLLCLLAVIFNGVAKSSSSNVISLIADNLASQPHTHKKQTSIGFMKAHKSASSTVNNILMRFGWSHKLNFILPMENHMYVFLPPHRFNASLVARNAPWNLLKPDLMVSHSSWNKDELAKLLPPDAKFISILRDPVEQFRSSFSWKSMDKFYRTTLEAFAASKDIEKFCPVGLLGRNQMLVDFGMPRNDTSNMTKVRNFVKQMDKEFDLVLIAERFEESVVLMKELFHWDFEDVAFVRLNSAASSKKPLSPMAQKRLRKYLEGDYFLYNHFRKKLEMKLRAFGNDRMKASLEKLRDVNKAIVTNCGVHNVRKEEGIPKHQRGYNDHYVELKDVADPSNEYCLNFVLKEDGFLKKLRDTQIQRLRQLNLSVNDAIVKWQPYITPGPPCKKKDQFNCCICYTNPC
ncbi:unnamed protein product [Cyprideis torosa]|uniref:Uncharacterized protein n=1 Tax=Cyprideis torosa TaxID=163714 RepID=A0A7R8WQE2_9CRUS|nr:unnamed protein product [Cyprideis torosa]CAG0902411.1 unnamed protein product [Cyprideis torosa]